MDDNVVPFSERADEAAVERLLRTMRCPSCDDDLVGLYLEVAPRTLKVVGIGAEEIGVRARGARIVCDICESWWPLPLGFSIRVDAVERELDQGGASD